jgi:hypothetical protein
MDLSLQAIHKLAISGKEKEKENKILREMK